MGHCPQNVVNRCKLGLFAMAAVDQRPVLEKHVAIADDHCQRRRLTNSKAAIGETALLPMDDEQGQYIAKFPSATFGWWLALAAAPASSPSCAPNFGAACQFPRAQPASPLPRRPPIALAPNCRTTARSFSYATTLFEAPQDGSCGDARTMQRPREGIERHGGRIRLLHPKLAVCTRKAGVPLQSSPQTTSKCQMPPMKPEAF